MGRETYAWIVMDYIQIAILHDLGSQCRNVLDRSGDDRIAVVLVYNGATLGIFPTTAT